MTIIESLFGAKYFGFIASSYAISATALIVLTLWIVLTYKRRKLQLVKLEEAGLRRASKAANV